MLARALMHQKGGHREGRWASKAVTFALIPEKVRYVGEHSMENSVPGQRRGMTA